MELWKVIDGKPTKINVTLSLHKTRKAYADIDADRQTARDAARKADTRHSINNVMADDAMYNNVLHGVRGKLKTAASSNPDAINPLRNALEYDIRRDTADTADNTLSDAMDILIDAWIAAAEFNADDTVKDADGKDKTRKDADGEDVPVNAQYDAARKATGRAIQQHRRKDGKTSNKRVPVVYVPLYEKTGTDADGKAIYECVADKANYYLIEDDYSLAEFKDILARAVKTKDISDRQAKIIKYLFVGYTQAEIADKLHVSQSAIAQNISTIRKRFDYLPIVCDDTEKLTQAPRLDKYMSFCGTRRGYYGITGIDAVMTDARHAESVITWQDMPCSAMAEYKRLRAWLASAYHDNHVTIGLWNERLPFYTARQAQADTDAADAADAARQAQTDAARQARQAETDALIAWLDTHPDRRRK